MVGDEASEGERLQEEANWASQPEFLFLVDGDHTNDILPLVCDLVVEADGGLLLAAVTSVPEQTPPTLAELQLDSERRLGRYVLKAKQECSAIDAIDRVAKVGHGRGHMVEKLVESHEISTVITEDVPRSGLRSLLGFEGVDEEAWGTDCDTVIVTRTNRTVDIESILVPIAGGPHSGLAVDIGAALAQQNDAALELLHVYPTNDDDAEAQGDELLGHGIDRVGSYKNVERTLLDAGDMPLAIIEHAEPFDVTILGAPREGLIQQFLLGTIPQSVSAETDGTVLVTHRGGADESWLHRWL